MEKWELKKIIIKQREYYAEALDRLARLLRDANHKDFAEIAMKFKEHYGLEGAFDDLSNKMLTRDEFREEIIRAFQRHRKDWIAFEDIKKELTAEYNETDWRYIIHELFKQGQVDRKGTYNRTVYQWIGE